MTSKPPFKVYSPNVVKRQNEIEYRCFRDFDKDSSRDHAEKHQLAYSAAYLFSETSVLSDNRAMLRLEYEFF